MLKRHLIAQLFNLLSTFLLFLHGRTDTHDSLTSRTFDACNGRIRQGIEMDWNFSMAIKAFFKWAQGIRHIIHNLFIMEITDYSMSWFLLFVNKNIMYCLSFEYMVDAYKNA